LLVEKHLHRLADGEDLGGFRWIRRPRRCRWRLAAESRRAHWVAAAVAVDRLGGSVVDCGLCRVAASRKRKRRGWVLFNLKTSSSQAKDKKS
jgi:hypothetical protein